MNTNTKQPQKTQQNTWYGSVKDRMKAWKEVKNTLAHKVAQKLKKDVDQTRSEWD